MEFCRWILGLTAVSPRPTRRVWGLAVDRIHQEAHALDGKVVAGCVGQQEAQGSFGGNPEPFHVHGVPGTAEKFSGPGDARRNRASSRGQMVKA